MNGSTAVRQTKAFLKNKPPSVSMEIEFNVSLQLITLNLLQTNSTVSKKYSKCTGTYTHITHVGRYTHKAYISLQSYMSYTYIIFLYTNIIWTKYIFNSINKHIIYVHKLYMVHIPYSNFILYVKCMKLYSFFLKLKMRFSVY